MDNLSLSPRVHVELSQVSSQTFNLICLHNQGQNFSLISALTSLLPRYFSVLLIPCLSFQKDTLADRMLGLKQEIKRRQSVAGSALLPPLLPSLSLNTNTISSASPYHSSYSQSLDHSSQVSHCLCSDRVHCGVTQIQTVRGVVSNDHNENWDRSDPNFQMEFPPTTKCAACIFNLV